MSAKDFGNKIVTAMTLLDMTKKTKSERCAEREL